MPLACWACRGLQASSLAWFLLCLPRLFSRCLAHDGLSPSEVVSIAWDPHPRKPVEGVFRATSMLELAAELADSRDTKVVEVFSSRRGPDSPLSHYLSLCWFRSHVVVLGEARARLASRGRAWRVPLLDASIDGLVAVVVMMFPHDASKYDSFRSLILGCQSVVALTYMDSRPHGVSEGSFLFSEFLLLWPVRDCVVARCVHAVVARLALDSLAGVSPVWRMVAGKSRCAAPSLRHLSVVVVDLVLAGCELWLRCIAWLPCVLNYASVVLVEVLPGPACIVSAVLLVAVFSMKATVVLPPWFKVCRLVGLCSGEWDSCVPVVRWFASLLAPCVLLQMVVWAGADVAFCALLGLQSFACGFWRVFGEESFLLARGVVSAAGAPVALSVVCQALVVACVLVFPHFGSKCVQLWYPALVWVPLSGCAANSSLVLWLCVVLTMRKVFMRPTGDSGCHFRVLRVLRVHLVSLLDRKEGFAGDRVGFGIAQHLWGCRPSWTPHVWLE
ncbi:hypothetical protein Taro_025747 [Colocasia esculenta]|uniref:Uncharacterized protein n=1 Tax=Colocasia esculenta TaxID=4460 RepID=A0A843VHG6_COLES|nr:hypothetical protein [Colocasia esculenta]